MSKTVIIPVLISFALSAADGTGDHTVSAEN